MVSIEDPFDQDDWDGYRPFTAAVGDKARDSWGGWTPSFAGKPIFLLVLRDYRRFQRKRCESRKTTKSMHSSLWRLRNYVEML